MTSNLSNGTSRCITIAIAGEPNVGKSTIVNLISGKDVSIATNKPQTTRFNVKGIYSQGEHQIIFVDTPGVFKFKGRSGLEKYIISNAWTGIRSSDKIMLVVDPKKKLSDGFKYLQSEIERSGEQAILVINKIDITKPEELEEFEASIPNKHLFDKIFRLSAKADLGVVPLIEYLKDISPVAPWAFKDGEVTDLDIEETLSEITRKHIFLNFKQEIPYSSRVETISISQPYQQIIKTKTTNLKQPNRVEDLLNDDYDEDQGNENESGEVVLKTIDVIQNVIVDKDNHKKIVIGAKGVMLTKLLKDASADMQEFLADGTRVKLRLVVKVKPNWREKINY